MEMDGLRHQNTTIQTLRDESLALLQKKRARLLQANKEQEILISECLLKIQSLESKMLEIQENMSRLGLGRRRIKTGFFDSKYYLKANPDVASAGENPIGHYVFSGYFEGRRSVPIKKWTRILNKLR